MSQAAGTYLDPASGQPLHPAARAVLERPWDGGTPTPAACTARRGDLRLGCTASTLDPSNGLAAMGSQIDARRRTAYLVRRLS